MKPVNFLFLSFAIFLFDISMVKAQVIEQQLVLKIPKPRSTFDISHNYHLTLLNMALVKAAKGRLVPTFEIIETRMSQGRASSELIKGELLDVYWLGSDQDTNEQLRAVKIPTTRGLIGFRQFIINSESLSDFDQVSSVEDLKKFVACQGAHWPDTKVLSDANLSVTTSTIYENLFKMLDAKRCDYFPRAFHDIKNELVNFKALYPNLIQYERILLHYPFAVYFYTNKSNEYLARWIEDGLELLTQEGAIEALMVKHPLTAHIFPLKEQKHMLYLPLHNDQFDSTSRVEDPQYWFIPKDFGIEISQK